VYEACAKAFFERTFMFVYLCALVSWPMFPLSCACVRDHKDREMNAHKKTWSAHKFFSKKIAFCALFQTYRSKRKW